MCYTLRCWKQRQQEDGGHEKTYEIKATDDFVAVWRALEIWRRLKRVGLFECYELTNARHQPIPSFQYMIGED